MATFTRLQLRTYQTDTSDFSGARNFSLENNLKTIVSTRLEEMKIDPVNFLIGTNDDIKNALADKVSAALDDAKVDVARSVFTGQQGADAPEANVFSGNDIRAETPEPELESDEVAQ